MKLEIIISISLMVLVSCSPIPIDGPLNVTSVLDFDSFKVDFKKSYSTQTEHLKR